MNRKQCREAHVIVSDREVKRTRGESVKAEETRAHPRQPEESSAKSTLDGRGSLTSGMAVRGLWYGPDYTRGSLQTKQAAELNQRKPLTRQNNEPASTERLREAKIGFRNREVAKSRRGKPLRGGKRRRA